MSASTSGALAQASSLAAMIGLGLGLGACSGNSEAAASRATAQATPAPASSVVDTENYSVQIKPVGDVKAGQEAAVEVTLQAKGSYHINAQYPYRFSTTSPAPDGVTFPKPVLSRADGTFDEKHGVFRVPFVASKAEHTKIGGTFSLSVCSEANCLMDKQTVGVDVTVQ
jgi:hypothetical protein